MLSDAVAFPISSGAEISISLYFPTRVATPTLYHLALKRAVVSQHGDHTREERIEAGALSKSSILVTAVLVPAQPSQRLIVAFGDSVVDGDQSTVDADHNWPSDLIRRMGTTSEGSKVAVVNEGIVGNRLLSDGSGVSADFGVSGLARFDRDALTMPGELTLCCSKVSMTSVSPVQSWARATLPIQLMFALLKTWSTRTANRFPAHTLAASR